MRPEPLVSTGGVAQIIRPKSEEWKPNVGNQRGCWCGDRSGRSFQGPGDRVERDTVCLAIPGQIVEFVDEPNRLARVDVAGVQRTINVGLLDAEDTGVAPGDWV